MEVLYDQAKDKNVAAIMIYGKSDDTKAYSDADCTNQMKTSEMKDAILKRAIIKIGDNYFMPVAFAIEDSTDVGTVTYAKGDSAFGTLVSIKD